MLFNGSGAAEIFEATANGTRVLFTRNIAAIVIDLSAGDALADTITVNGTALADNISITADTLLGIVFVSGLPTTVRIIHPEVANDDLIINGLAGTNTFTIGPGVTSLIGVTTNQ